MDSKWERVNRYIDLSIEETEAILKRIGMYIKVEKVEVINKGLRNTNYRVYSEDKSYLIRIYGCVDEWGIREESIYDRVSEIVNVPKVIGFDPSGETKTEMIGVFEYIDGRTLDEVELGKNDRICMFNKIGMEISKLHNIEYSAIGFLNDDLKVKEILPPIRKWYDMFFGSAVKSKLGVELSEKVEGYLIKNRRNMKRLENKVSLVHNDFRPINIIIDSQNNPYIIDWEGAMAAHSIGDIGQFLRFKEQVGEEEERAFIRGYNEVADKKLPDDYKKLAKLADMVNLIQMLNNERNLKNKDGDLIELIRETIEGR